MNAIEEKSYESKERIYTSHELPTEIRGSCIAVLLERSTNTRGTDLFTFALRYPRYIHSQVMTHRMFSRNAASSRAIPTHKLIEQVRNDPVRPTSFRQNRKGMSGGEEWYSEVDINGKSLSRSEAWSLAAKIAAGVAEAYMEAGYHKEIVNRILEPYLYIDVIVTTTDLYNFFKLRIEDDAQPEIQDLACAMQDLVNNTKATEQWVHCPLLTTREKSLLRQAIKQKRMKIVNEFMLASAARCARVSYANHFNGTIDLTRDLALADALASDEHLSPFEHQAFSPRKFKEICFLDNKGITFLDKKNEFRSGNLLNWIQFRQILNDSSIVTLDEYL